MNSVIHITIEIFFTLALLLVFLRAVRKKSKQLPKKVAAPRLNYAQRRELLAVKDVLITAVKTILPQVKTKQIQYSFKGNSSLIIIHLSVEFSGNQNQALLNFIDRMAKLWNDMSEIADNGMIIGAKSVLDSGKAKNGIFLLADDPLLRHAIGAFENAISSLIGNQDIPHLARRFRLQAEFTISRTETTKTTKISPEEDEND